MILSGSLNLFTAKLDMVMHHYEPDCLSKVSITVKDNIIKIWLLNILSELLIFVQLNLVWWYIIIRWIVLWKEWIILLRSRLQKGLRIPVNVRLDDITSAAEPSVTKLGMLMEHHGPKCCSRRFICCLQIQGHKEGSVHHIWLFLPYLLNCRFLATRFNWMINLHKLECFV